MYMKGISNNTKYSILKTPEEGYIVDSFQRMLYD
jgi:hypothetical protein